MFSFKLSHKTASKRPADFLDGAKPLKVPGLNVDPGEWDISSSPGPYIIYIFLFSNHTVI